MFKKAINDMITCADNKTISMWKVIFWFIFLAAIGFFGYSIIFKDLSPKEFVDSMTNLLWGSVPVIGEEISDRLTDKKKESE